LEGKELESVKKQVLINMGMVQNSISWKYHSDLLDSLLFERDNSKECLIYALKSSGDNVKDDVRKLSDKALKNELKLITDERLMSEAQQTNDAEKISYEEAQSLMSNIDPTEAQQFQIDRALLVQRLGGDEDNSVITPNLIFNWLRDRKQGSIERMERYVQITRRSEAMNVNKKNLIDKISSADSTDLKLNPNLEIQLNSSRRKLTKFCSYDLPINETRITALCEIGIIALIDGNWHDSNSVMLIEIKQKICSNPVLLSLFGKGIASEDPKQWVKALNSILAENGFRVKNKRTRSDGQNQKRQYQYLPPTLTEAEKTDTRAAVEEADRLALIEAHWLQTERLEQGCNKAFDNKMEKMKDKISDYNFDKKSLILNEIPHYSEWATEAEIEAYDFMWNEAREHKRTTGEEGRCNEVMKAVRTDYEALQPTEILSLGKKSYSITKPLPRSCAEVVADIKAVSLSVPGNEDELDI